MPGASWVSHEDWCQNMAGNVLLILRFLSTAIYQLQWGWRLMGLRPSQSWCLPIYRSVLMPLLGQAHLRCVTCLEEKLKFHGCALMHGVGASLRLNTRFILLVSLDLFQVQVVPATPYDAKGLLLASIEDDNVIIFSEDKPLWLKREVPEYYTVPIQIHVRRRVGDF